MDIWTTLVIVFGILIGVCIIGSLVLVKDTKDFHVKVNILKGFEISGSFYEKQSTSSHQQ